METPREELAERMDETEAVLRGRVLLPAPHAVLVNQLAIMRALDHLLRRSESLSPATVDSLLRSHHPEDPA